MNPGTLLDARNRNGGAPALGLLAVVPAGPCQPRSGEVRRSPLWMEFVRVPAGSFLNGLPEFQARWHDDELQHEVRITGGCWLGKYEVTQGKWTADWYGEYPSGAVTDPTGPTTGSDRVIRGGSWGNSAGGVRSANRGHNSPGYRIHSIGFRLVRTE